MYVNDTQRDELVRNTHYKTDNSQILKHQFECKYNITLDILGGFFFFFPNKNIKRSASVVLK